MSIYHIKIVFHLGQKEMAVWAVNANDAVITALCEMGFSSLDIVVGIVIQ